MSEPQGVSFDLRSTVTFFKKYAVVFLILIPLLLSMYVRVQPAWMPITDGWAKNNVEEFYKAKIREQVTQQFPNLPQENLNYQVDKQFQQFLTQNKDRIAAETKQTSDQFKSFFIDPHGDRYLVGIDPYYYARSARNLIEKGTIGDIVVDGLPYDNHMIAPIPVKMKPELPMFVDAYTVIVLHLVGWNISLLSAVYFLPVWLCAIAVIPAFFLGRKIGGNIGGLIAGIVVAIHPNFLVRTFAGFADNDPYNVILPLLAVWFFVEGVDAKKDWNGYVWMLLSGISIGIFSLAWSGWWFIFDFMIAAFVMYLAYIMLLHKTMEKLTQKLLLLGVFLGSSMVFIALCTFPVTHSVSRGLGFFFGAFFGYPFHVLALKSIGEVNIWPNVLTTVAELNDVSLSNAFQNLSMGNLLFVVVAMTGVLITIIPKEPKKEDWYLLGITLFFYWVVIANADALGKIWLLILMVLPLAYGIWVVLREKREIDAIAAFVLMIWFVGGILGTTLGVRFIFLMVPALALGLGAAAGFLLKHLSATLAKGIGVERKWAAMVIIILLLLPFVSPVIEAVKTTRNTGGDMDDGWYNVLTAIKENSQPDAIITSWWDYGHWFKFTADRRVTFDGASQNLPQAHWVGKMLLTDDEEQAFGIQRMLDCGGYYAFRNILNQTGNDSLRSVKMLYDVFKRDREGARQYFLDQGLTPEAAEGVINLTHCTAPPESFFITSQDMVGKAGVWGHFGSWDFTKAEMHRLVKNEAREPGTKILKEKFNLTAEEATKLYDEIITSDPNQWIAPWPGFASSLAGCTKQGDLLGCGNGLMVNLSSGQASVRTQTGAIQPRSLVIYDNNGSITERKYNGGAAVSGVVFQDGEQYRSILSDPLQTKSMFTRLFYDQGKGLKHFKPFVHDRSVTLGEIYVWTIDLTEQNNSERKK
ncbi:hypothetical protein HZB02_05085 [Candidatus Woesearchaeota archaeon]|nr:hypothetical protein [Candidatus Woesearchaeota archaeon]